MTDEKPTEDKKPARKKAAPKKPYAVYSGNERDDVFAHKVIYKNQAARNSLSVLHVQRALQEKGYDQAALDKPGYYADGTGDALKQFSEDEGLPDADSLETLEALFDGDPNVNLHP